MCQCGNPPYLLQSGASPEFILISFLSCLIVSANQPNILHFSSIATSTMTPGGQQTTTIPSVVHSNTTSFHPITSPTDVQDGDGGVRIDSLSVGMGVAGTSLVFISAAFITITALLCLKRRRGGALDTTKNVAYSSSTSEIDSLSNRAYITTSDHGTTPNDGVYTYITVPTNNIPTFPNVAYRSSDILTSTNEAYQPVQCQKMFISD